MRILLAALMMQSALFAQAPMSIASVADALTGDTRLAPGSRALVRLSQSVAPGSVGSVMVQVGGKQAAILVVAEERVYVLLPLDLSPGPTALVVTSSGISTAPFALTLVSHAPVLATTRFWPGTYCPFLAPWGTSLVAFGLGATEPMVPALAVAPAMPLASTVVKPTVTIAGQEAEVLSSALVPDRTNDGSYAIDFRVPPGTPEGHHPVVLSIGGQNSNTEMLRVASATTASAAGYGAEGKTAPETIMSAYACSAPLATGEVVADSRNPPGILAGTTVEVKDSAGVERIASLLYASPRQVNYIIPPGTANGPATVTITSGDGAVSTITAEVDTIEPGLFVISGYLAALVVRIRDGVQTVEPVVQTVDGGGFELVPIDLGPASDQLFLLLFGTGLRGRSSLASVSASIGGVDAPVEYAGPQGEFAGLDQVNIRLPRSLSGRSGELLEISLTVDGKPANDPEQYLAFQ